MRVHITLVCLAVGVLRTTISREVLRLRREDDSTSWEANSEEDNDEDDENIGQGIGRAYCVRHVNRNLRLYDSLCSIRLEPHEEIRIVARYKCEDLKVLSAPTRAKSNIVKPEQVDPSQFLCGLKDEQYEWYCSPCAVERNGATYKRRQEWRCPQRHAETACKPNPREMIPGDGLSGPETPSTESASPDPRQPGSTPTNPSFSTRNIPLTTSKFPTEFTTNRNPPVETSATTTPTFGLSSTAGSVPLTTQQSPTESPSHSPTTQPTTEEPPSTTQSDGSSPETYSPSLRTSSVQSPSREPSGTSAPPLITSPSPPASTPAKPPVPPPSVGPPSPEPRATEAPSVTGEPVPGPRRIFPPLQQFCIPEFQGRHINCPCPSEAPPSIDFKVPNILSQKM